MAQKADVVVCGAGIAGVATAYQLAVRRGVPRVVLCDPRPPLTLTSDKSTECYRNLWPNQPMVDLANRSIDIIEELAAESGNAFGLNRRGYLYVTAESERLDDLEATARRAAELGSGPVRIHQGPVPHPSYIPAAPEGWEGSPTGTDLIRDPALLHEHFPGLSPGAIGALHVRRAGWLSAQQLGAYMLDWARDAGMEFLNREVVDIDVGSGEVQGVTLDDGTRIDCAAVVDAAGPMLDEVARLAGDSLPVHSEAHFKVAFRDSKEVVSRTAGLMIWTDTQRIDWSDEERGLLVSAGREDLLEELPTACHGRPEGGADSPWVLALWEYRRTVIEPVWPMPQDPLYAEVVMRGLGAMYPGMGEYADHLPQHVVDGGYYTKTEENRPLAGPMATPGMFVAGALSGFGIMAACGIAELASLHVTGESLPDYAPAFMLSRYDDPDYQREIAALAETGQL